MGKSTISMAIFNCYVSSPEGRFYQAPESRPGRSRLHPNCCWGTARDHYSWPPGNGPSVAGPKPTEINPLKSVQPVAGRQEMTLNMFAGVLCTLW